MPITSVYAVGVKRIPLNGHPTWVTIPKKKGPIVVLLHGGMSSSASLLSSIGPYLEKDFRVAAFDRRGHGATADTDEPFSYDAMADEAIAFISYLGKKVHLVGHSDGGNVALIVAMKRPDLVHRMVVVGANYHFDGVLPQDDFDVEGPYFNEWKVKYGSLSPNGEEHAREAYIKTTTMFATQPTFSEQDLKAITVPTLVMAGDDDVIRTSHTVSMFDAIEGSQLCIVPGTSHALLKERTKFCSRIIRRFLKQDGVAKTFMPQRVDRKAAVVDLG